MKKFVLMSFFGLQWFFLPVSAYAQAEVAALQQRIADLERQNKQIMQQLAELTDRMTVQQPQAAPAPNAIASAAE